MPFIFLDRDGVINYDSLEYIKSPDEWEAIPGSLEAIAQLNRAGYRVLIVTNQSGVARGHYNIEMLDSIHEKMQQELAAVGGHVEEIFFCPHHPNDHCNCRKPKPGMLHKIRDKYDVNLKDVFFIGDSFTDMQVAAEAGCKPILVLTGNGQRTLEQHPELSHIDTFADLTAAVNYILNLSSQNKTKHVE